MSRLGRFSVGITGPTALYLNRGLALRARPATQLLSQVRAPVNPPPRPATGTEVPSYLSTHETYNVASTRPGDMAKVSMWASKVADLRHNWLMPAPLFLLQASLQLLQEPLRRRHLPGAQPSPAKVPPATTGIDPFPLTQGLAFVRDETHRESGRSRLHPRQLG